MSDIDFEREHAVAQIKLEEAQRTHDREANLHKTYFEAAAKSAEVAVKTSVVVNGGAAVAILALIGGLVSKDIVNVKQLAEISNSLIWFALGVTAAVTALAFIYLMNYSSAARVAWRKRVFEHPYVRETDRSMFMRNIYTIAHVIAVLISLLSVVLFIVGIVKVRDSITQFAKPASASTTSPPNALPSEGRASK